jgi:hypothetical protein
MAAVGVVGMKGVHLLSLVTMYLISYLPSEPVHLDFQQPGEEEAWLFLLSLRA